MYIFLNEIYKELKMNKLEKLNLIRNLCEEHNITGYEIGKNTKISSYAAHKILIGDTKNPNESTIDIILEFLEKAITGTDVKPESERKLTRSTSIEDIIADKVFARLEPYLINIEQALSHLILDNDDNQEMLSKKEESNN